MTDNEIIKTLECCMEEHSCSECIYHLGMTSQCMSNLMRDTLDLINRQKAEINSLMERLDIADKETQLAHKANIEYVIETEKSKAKAIKEFAEKLKSLVNQNHYMLANIHNSKDFGMFTLGFEQAIDEIVKEMTDVQK